MKLLKVLGKIVLSIVAGLVALFILFYVLTIGDYSVAKTVAQDSSIPHITLNGATFHAETFGDPADPVVIVLHGGPGSDYRSMLNLQALSDEYFVVFYDQRGTGLSARVDPKEITLDSYLADLDAFVDHYSNGKKVNLLGHSWGAMLVSAYLGKHPDKVDHVILAEPGFLNSEFAAEFLKATSIHYSPGLLYHFVKTKFESLHVKGPDEQAADDYFAHQMDMYQGSDHPLAGYRCSGSGPEEGETWRNGAWAAGSFGQQLFDAEGNIHINLVEGVDAFTGKVLFMAGECGTIIGPEWQKQQMKLLPNADLAVIPAAGHEMFLQNPEASISVIREYLGAPIR